MKSQKELGIEIIALDMDPASSGMFMAHGRAVIPAPAHPSFIAETIALCRRLKAQCLIPIIDEELLIFAANRERFAAAGIKLIANSAQTVRLAKDKYLSYQFCLRQGILAPRTFLPAQIKAIKNSDYPLIIKPVAGRGSQDTVKLNSARELDFFRRGRKDYIIQEFVYGDEYTIDIVASPDGHILQALPRQRVMVKAGMSYNGRTVKDRRLISYGKAVAKKFFITGPFNVQCIVNKKGIYLLEVNPKFSAGLPLTVAAGVNIPLILVKFAFGMAVKKKELIFRDGLYMLRFWEEIFVPGFRRSAA